MVQNKEALINLVKPSDLVVEHVLFLQQIFLTLLIAFPDGVTLSCSISCLCLVLQAQFCKTFLCLWQFPVWEFSAVRTEEKPSEKNNRARQWKLWRALIVLIFTALSALFFPVSLFQDSCRSSKPSNSFRQLWSWCQSVFASRITKPQA